MKKEKPLWIHFSTHDGVSGDYVLKSTVRAAVFATLKSEGIDRPAEVSVTFCGAKFIRRLNRKFRNKDAATDVLSFPLNEKGDIESNGEEPLELGDIVISLERAEEQANELGHSFLREVAFLAVHSTLHLLGYDHELSPEDEEDMCARQRKVMETLAPHLPNCIPIS